MKPSQTGKNYDKLADHWNSDKFNRLNGIEQHKRALKFMKENGPALDIGCGSSGRIIDLLLENNLAVEAIDASESMINLAKKRHPEITFHHQDITVWKALKKYQFISAWDSIWHLPLESQEPVLTKICDLLLPDGIFIFTTGGVDIASEKIDTFMGSEMYYSVLGISKTLEVLASAGCVCRHLEYDQYPELHLYIIAQKTPKLI